MESNYIIDIIQIVESGESNLNKMIQSNHLKEFEIFLVPNQFTSNRVDFQANAIQNINKFANYLLSMSFKESILQVCNCFLY